MLCFLSKPSSKSFITVCSFTHLHLITIKEFNKYLLDFVLLIWQLIWLVNSSSHFSFSQSIVTVCPDVSRDASVSNQSWAGRGKDRVGRREFESFCASFPFDIVVLFVLVNRAFILEMFLDHDPTSRKKHHQSIYWKNVCLKFSKVWWWWWWLLLLPNTVL